MIDPTDRRRVPASPADQKLGTTASISPPAGLPGPPVLPKPPSTSSSLTSTAIASASSSVIMAVMATDNSPGRGVLIALLSAFGSAAFVLLIIALIYFLRFTNRGRILLDRLGRPGEFDDEQAFLREEAEALETMDEIERSEYWRARAFVESNPPDSIPTDISLSQFLAIQEKGVSAWEFEAELEIANCFVEARTEVEFYDTECSVQSNLPVPKQNEVYYWECKIFEKPETTLVAIGMSTKPYPMFRLPGYHRHSVAYLSDGSRRYNQPFNPTPYAHLFRQGDVIGVGYRPRTGTIFFTRNGKKLDDVCHGLKSQNFFPTVGARGPAKLHINFGQLGFVFIEANVKKWGLAPMTGSLAPPPPYGNEAGSILLESGRAGVREGESLMDARTFAHHHQAIASQNLPQLSTNVQPPSPGSTSGKRRTKKSHRYTQSQPRNLPPTSPGPIRSPTDISLAPINPSQPPPEYTSGGEEDSSDDTDGGYNDERRRLLGPSTSRTQNRSRSQSEAVLRRVSPPIPSYGEVMSSRNNGEGTSGGH
ncbi:hypothetical protein AA313_de0205648 [Arthrobotrys entomopaga]|nr:hypothetical protein AA313_de0205648 [Arthrobotrys entomopaga]